MALVSRGNRSRLFFALLVTLCFGVLYSLVTFAFFPQDRWSKSAVDAKYVVLPNVLRSGALPAEHRDSVTLVLHCTLDYVDKYLDIQIKSWKAPISLAVFVQDADSLREAQEYFQRITFPTDLLKVAIFYRRPELDSPPDDLYPINAARNIARFEAETRLFLSGDIENALCCDYNRRIKKLANRLLIQEKQKTVLVHRRFEQRENLTLLDSKARLVEGLKNGDVVEFHKLFYAEGHAIPELEQWVARPEEEDVAVVAEIPYKNAYWEPQFVAADDVPFHNERFPFRMRSNTHLASILCRRGYSFSIVSDLFSVHEGIKTKETSTERMAKKNSMRKGYLQVVDEFRNQLDLLYPETRQKCPGFNA